MFKKNLIVLVIFFSFTGTSISATLDDAFAFVLAGEAGWDGFVNHNVRGCEVTTTVDLSLLGLGNVKNTVDFNKVKWKSARYGVVNGQQMFIASCEGKCNMTPNEDFKLLMAMSGSPWNDNQLMIQVTVTRDRYEKALKMVARECPGVETAF